MNFDPVISYFQTQLPDLMAIYAFGSRVSQKANADSDLDLAILVPTPIPTLSIWNMMNELANIVGCPVDIVDLRNATTVMQHQVINTGIRLWEKMNSGRMFEVFVYNQKLDLDERRRDLLNDIQKSGRIYGR